MKRKSADSQHPVKTLLDHVANTVGLRLCYHDNLSLSGLPKEYRMHLHPACQQARKGKNARKCVEFDVHRTHRELAGVKEGRIQHCPFGLTEIAVPVFVGSALAGVLFAGPCWHNKSPCPHDQALVVQEKKWLEERHTLLQAVASHLSSILEESEEFHGPWSTRRGQIVEYIRNHIHLPLRVADLAGELNLSVSRTSHIVSKLFGISFPKLVTRMKLEYSTHWLSASDLAVGEIALRLGFNDQNYFSRLFTKIYGMSPTRYRHTHPPTA